MRHLLPLLLLGLGGCSLPGAFGSPLDDYARPAYGGGSYYYQGYQDPLRATLWYDEYTGFASFDLNRQAHVALFAIRPMGGIEMIYPAIGYGARQLFTRGSHNIRTNVSPYRFASSWSLASGANPIYIVLIASERPLDVAPFMATGSLPWLSRASVTWNPYSATEVLAREIVPQPNTTDWTVAYHVVWPQSLRSDRYRRRAYTWVVCPGNVVISVPVEAVRNGWVYCPNGVRADTGRDSRLPRVKETVPKRPLPDGWMGPYMEPGEPLVETLDRLGRRPDRPVDSTRVRLPWRRTAGTGDDDVGGERRRPAPLGVDASDPVGPRVRPTRPEVVVTRPVARPAATPARPTSDPRAERPGTRVRPAALPDRPEATPRSRPVRATRPAPRAQPRPQRPAARPKPAPRPAARPAPPPRPAPKPKPTKKPKKKPKGGGGG